MDVNNYLKKVELILEYVFEGKIVLNESHAEQLLEFLEDRNGNSPGKQILESPRFIDLVVHSLANINNFSNTVKVFLIKIITILFKNELDFTKMQMQGFQDFSYQFCTLTNLTNLPPPTLHLAYIKLATMQVTHRSGFNIIIERKMWKNILYPKIHHRPKYISNAASEFMAKLVWKLNECNSEAELLEVLGYLVEPILSSRYLNVPVLDTETDAELSNEIFAHLWALLAVLNEADKYGPANKVIVLLKKHFIVDHRLFQIFTATKNSNLLRLFNSCMFRYWLAVLQHLLYSNQIDNFCNKMAAFHRNYLVHAIHKREAFTIVDFVIQSNITWSHFEKSHASEFNFPLNFERNGYKIEFSLQIVAHLIVPLLTGRSKNRLERSDVVEQFVTKMGRSITDYIYTSCYLFAELLKESGVTFRKKVTTFALKEFLRLKGYLHDLQAGPLFQGLYYLLDIFIIRDETGGLVVNENPIDPDELRLLSHLLEAMKMLLKEHNIPWYENLEIVSVQADLLNLIKQSFLTTKHVVQVLDLINICVQKFLSPNMSLLVESRSPQSNTLNETGKFIKMYVQSEDWEVRDSALNLLHSCTEISFIKYIPLRKVIRENNLMILAARAALTDTEYYCQCIALKCLSAATKIDEIWQEVLVNNAYIHLQLVHMLRNHCEGMVRKEAANVLTGVYLSQKVALRFINTLYEVMLAAVLDDMHWEVQMAALHFWKSVIHNQLTDRGMLDGEFPSVTFSKEKRKIITLNDREIQRQVTNIMNHLSNVGCLTALLECMNEMNHIEVMDQAYCIAKDLVKMLDKYKFETVTENVETEQAEASPKYMEEDDNIPTDAPRVTSDEEKYKVIDSILSVDLCEHIINLHDNYSKPTSEEMDIDLAYCPRRQFIRADQFIENFKNKDFALLLEEKKNSKADFVSTLDELLDEMMELCV